MHFLIYYIREDLNINKHNKGTIARILETDFFNDYCDGCGENDPGVCDITDWFQIGGRWFNSLTTKRNKGIKGEVSWTNEKERKYLMSLNTKFDIANIKDIDMKFFEMPNTIVYDGNVYQYGLQDKELKTVYAQIKKGKIQGVLCAIDGHM